MLLSAGRDGFSPACFGFQVPVKVWGRGFLASVGLLCHFYLLRCLFTQTGVKLLPCDVLKSALIFKPDRRKSCVLAGSCCLRCTYSSLNVASSPKRQTSTLSDRPRCSTNTNLSFSAIRHRFTGDCRKQKLFARWRMALERSNVSLLLARCC